MNKDLTVGNIRKVLWLYSLPLLGSVIFQQLYNVADSLVAGNFIGANALAAVGNASEITFIYTAFAVGCNIGCSVVVSQLFGAKRYKELKTAITTAFIAFGILCVSLMICGFLFTKPLLHGMHTPDEIFADSYLYLKIYTLGMPFVFFYNIATGIFSAMGDSKTPLYYLMFSSVSNIIVNVLFVKEVGMGVEGLALATLLCQGISCILSMGTLLKRLKTIQVEGKAPLFSKSLLMKTIRIAVPSILQQSFISVGNILIQGVVNGFGPSVIAGFTAAIKLNTIATSCFMAIANGLSTFTAQNIGAKKIERVQRGHKEGLLLGELMSAILIFLFVGMGSTMVGFFMSENDTQALAAGIQFLRIVAPFYLAISVKIITDGVLRGSGAVHLFMISTFADLFIRIILAMILPNYLGVMGIWLSWPIGWFIGMLLAVGMYIQGGWKKASI